MSSWRSGSSFVGELINSAPGVFYSFEPIHFFEYHQPKPINLTEMDLVRSVFDCKFTNDYLKHQSDDFDGQPALPLNRRLLEACQHPVKSLCVRPDFVGHFCSYFPVRLIKEVRLTLHDIHNGALIDDEEGVEYRLSTFLNQFNHI